MIDSMLYGDLELEVKLTDAITGFKVASKTNNVENKQESAPQLQQINQQNVLHTAVNNVQPQYDAATALLFTQ